MKDPIERQAAIDAVLSACKDTKTTECAVRELEELPSAQPQKGEWIDYSDDGYVSVRSAIVLQIAKAIKTNCTIVFHAEQN